MDLVTLFVRIARIARTRQPGWKLVVIAIVVAIVASGAALEWAGLWPEQLRADRPRLPRL